MQEREREVAEQYGQMSVNKRAEESKPSGRPPRRGKKQRIQLSDHFTYSKMIIFVAPTVGMMIFGSIYWCIDGLFISRFAGSTALAAANLILPPVMIMGSVGFMLGTGGAALVGKVLGEQDRERANGYFSMVVYATLITGIILTVIGEFFVPQVASALGAEDGEFHRLAVLYGRIALAGIPPYVLQYLFQTFFITAEKPRLGFWVTVAAGGTHVLLDAVFIAGLGMGLAGAATAMDLGECVGGIFPLIYFFRKNDSLLRLGRPRWDWTALGKAATNGASEFLSNISFSIVNMAFNYELMRFVGEDGVAAYGVIMYFSAIFTSLFWGISTGVSPVISYHYGAQNKRELNSLLKKSLMLEFVSGVLMAALGVLLARPLCILYLGNSGALTEMTIWGFKLYSISYVMLGFGYFGSAFFTALNNGLISGTIATLRVLVLQAGCVVVMANLFGLNGIWSSYIVAQFLGAALSFGFIIANRKKYGYMGPFDDGPAAAQK